MKAIVKGFSTRKCAFCKNWYDPCNEAIVPLQGKDTWEYETSIVRKCMTSNMMIRANHGGCKSFQSKI